MQITSMKEVEDGDWELQYSATDEEIIKFSNIGARFLITCLALGVTVEGGFEILQKELPNVPA
jgi:hypothetical protein